MSWLFFFFFFLFLSRGNPPQITYGVALLFCLTPQQRDVFGELLFYAVIKAAGYPQPHLQSDHLSLRFSVLIQKVEHNVCENPTDVLF